MHVVLDFNPVIRERFSGFWSYGWSLLRGLAAREEIHRLSLLCEAGRLENCQSIPDLAGPKIARVATGVSLHRWRRWWRVMPWPTLGRWCGPFDVYHCIHHLMPPTRRRPRVLTVHDLRRYRLRELIVRSRVELFERAVRAADRLIAISESTRRDLVELLGVDDRRIDVVPLAVGEQFRPLAPAQVHAARQWLTHQAGRPVDHYVLCLGSRDARKNIPTVIRAFARAAEHLDPGFCLVIAGTVREDEALGKAIALPGLAGRVVMTGPVPHEQFPSVLGAADMMVFLSLYEGFGLPVAEALACGVPVIAADNSSQPEVVGPAGVLVDAMDISATAEAIVSLAHDSTRRAALVAAGLERAKLFSTARLAEGTLAAYRRALGS